MPKYSSHLLLSSYEVRGVLLLISKCTFPIPAVFMGHKIDKNHFMATFIWISSSTSSDQITPATLFLFKSKLLFQVFVCHFLYLLLVHKQFFELSNGTNIKKWRFLWLTMEASNIHLKSKLYASSLSKFRSKVTIWNSRWSSF